ncbi:MAG: carboxypeptidase-like regulatory domain-containing protein [Candidatus Sulfotelmatobacter sp.]
MTTPRFHTTFPLARLSTFCLLLLFFCAAFGPHVLSVVNASPGSKNLKPTDPYALIFGTVWGPGDRPVYGITVKIRRLPDKKPKWQVYSDHSGEFALRVPAGKADYVVSADLKGVKMTDGSPLHLAEEVPVHVEYDERVDIGLHLTK